ncbi:RtcB family protein [Draconibacterium sediminis]|uniref:RtcB family protein n=1 Tax=Draconibacterium sediminis TaxID=1544798 RepID=UPI0026F0E4CF|nr:RtcB family protein [Draconibacterium sediminis]
MKQVVSEGCRVPIKMWVSDIEENALAQARNLANLPFIFKHVALMPDCHSGYGMPIGGVIATKGVIIPNAVGVDIGCGMCAVKTSLNEINTDVLKTIMSGIRELVPLGFDHHKQAQEESLMPSLENVPEHGIVHRQYTAAKKQIGTLGGGNHFIEIQKGSDGHVWIMIHSGSRNIGLKVAEHYNKLATHLNERWHSSVDKKQDLAFLPIETQQAKDYFAEMQYCVGFAFANRRLMMERIKSVFSSVIGESFSALEFINIAHNYARWESHFGTNVIVHRKGATSAREGEVGIIPGSQGTKSYIVQGKGNTESFQSCSHGAGRTMGRKQAQRELVLEEEIEKLNSKGIVHSIRNIRDLDEAPGAYKNIDVVMENQADLVDILVELSPLAVIKG